MRSIKLKIVAWVIAFMCIVGLAIAQDDSIEQSAEYEITPFVLLDDVEPYLEYEINTLPWPDTFVIENSPVVVTVESEPLENNEVLQTMLELENEQTDALNQNLSQLNQTARDLPNLQIEAKQSVLKQYSLNPEQIQEQFVNRTLLFGATSLCGVFLIFILCIIENKNKLYWRKKEGFKKDFVYGAVVIIVSMIAWMISIVSIDGFYLFQNVDKLM